MCPVLLRILAATTTVAVLVVLPGCSTSGPADGSLPSAVDPADCAEIAASPAPPSAPLLSVVVDRTASGLGLGLGSGSLAFLADAQRAGAVLDMTAVDGGGVAPRAVLRGVPLDPLPDVDSAQADAARATALACVPFWASGEATRPTAPGSDVLAAVAGEARKRPARLLVDSDGEATAGGLDLRRVRDVDPAAVSDALARGDLLVTGLDGTQVHWNAMGETSTPLPEPLRSGVERTWRAILQRMGAGADRVTVDARPGAPTVDPGGPRPSDPIDVPAVDAVDVPGGRVLTVPDALLFDPGSRQVLPGADAVLVPLVPGLTAGTSSVTVVGHTADYGDESYRQRLSTDRARAVAARLVALGVPAALVGSRGVGSTEPLRPEWVDGTHDDVAAAANRRVSIEIR